MDGGGYVANLNCFGRKLARLFQTLLHKAKYSEKLVLYTMNLTMNLSVNVYFTVLHYFLLILQLELQNMDKYSLKDPLRRLLEDNESDVKMEAAWSLFNSLYVGKYVEGTDNIDNGTIQYYIHIEVLLYIALLR